MVCPRCNDDRCYIIEESETRQKGYGLGKGCCGYVLLGPPGWLCGLFGMGKGRTTRQAFWVCQNCGKKFKA